MDEEEMGYGKAKKVFLILSIIFGALIFISIIATILLVLYIENAENINGVNIISMIQFLFVYFMIIIFGFFISYFLFLKQPKIVKK